MKPGKTELRLNAEIEKRGALFAVLLDPDTSDEAAFVKAGSLAAENGADLLLVGGSYLGNFTLPKQVAALKANVSLPVVLFPGGASQVVPGFDAMLFMTLVSGRNPNYLIDEQVRGGALVRALNMEAIPTHGEFHCRGTHGHALCLPRSRQRRRRTRAGRTYRLHPQGDRNDHHHWWWHQGPANSCSPRRRGRTNHRDRNPLGEGRRSGAPQGICRCNSREGLKSFVILRHPDLTYISTLRSARCLVLLAFISFRVLNSLKHLFL